MGINLNRQHLMSGFMLLSLAACGGGSGVDAQQVVNDVTANAGAIEASVLAS